LSLLRVESPGWLTTVQDLGRLGHERFGVPPSGALDEFALRAANALVGNVLAAAALEFGLDGAALTPDGDCLVAVAGSGQGLALRVNGRGRPLWTAVFVRARQTLEIVKRPGGWAYLSVRGGVDVPVVMGARATYLRARLGGVEGRALRAGDQLPIGSAPDGRGLLDLAGRRLPPEHRPTYPPAAGAEATIVGVILGPQHQHFSPQSVATFLAAEYAVTAESDRMGCRLSGPALVPQPADLISEAMPLGAVQVPAGGAPIVMLADRPTTGGYPKIAVVARADVPLVAQCPPGTGRLRFREITVAEAQSRYRAQLARLNQIDENQDPIT
jgi:antagonist of KipI